MLPTLFLIKITFCAFDSQLELYFQQKNTFRSFCFLSFSKLAALSHSVTCLQKQTVENVILCSLLFSLIRQAYYTNKIYYLFFVASYFMYYLKINKLFFFVFFWRIWFSLNLSENRFEKERNLIRFQILTWILSNIKDDDDTTKNKDYHFFFEFSKTTTITNTVFIKEFKKTWNRF